MKQVKNFMFAISLFLAFSVQVAAAAYIDETEAKSIAFQHAGLLEKEISAVSVKQYKKHGIRLYDITFSGIGVKYNYKIDAISGEIMEYERRRTLARRYRGQMTAVRATSASKKQNP
jgi:opacity protein-like surface antigen